MSECCKDWMRYGGTCEGCPEGPSVLDGSRDSNPETPTERAPKRPWWHGLLNWKRWLR